LGGGYLPPLIAFSVVYQMDTFGWCESHPRFGAIVAVYTMALYSLNGVQFAITPTGYVPGPRQTYLVAFAQLPGIASSLERN